MKIFLSWAGERSKMAASALSTWIPDVVQNVETWVSNHDIAAGSRWVIELGEKLETINFGILCLTPENLSREWILFEAGCLAKFARDSRVVPYFLGLNHSDVRFPLAQF